MRTPDGPRISTYHRYVLGIGFPTMIFSGLLWAYASTQAQPSYSRPNPRLWQRIPSTFSGEGAIDLQVLHTAQVSLVVFLISLPLTVVLAIWPEFVKERRAKRGPQLDLRFAFKDMSFWQVGDRAGWRDDDGIVHTGIIERAHRRPFDFDGEQIRAFAGGPGFVMNDDETGELVGRDFGSIWRIVGTPGASGTLDSIRDEMNAAVSAGDGFSWLDPSGDPVEGTVVEIHRRAFSVAGKRVDASAKRPGYTVKRATDGTLVGISDNLRE